MDASRQACLTRVSHAAMAMLPEAFVPAIQRVLTLDVLPAVPVAVTMQPGSVPPASDAVAKVPRLPRTDKAIVVLPIKGSIGIERDWFTDTGTTWLGAMLDEAMASPAVGAVVFAVNSPGGSVYGTPELAEKIAGYRGTKPMYAVAEGLMASAAYWIGSAADKVFASPSTEVGSIGVWSAHMDQSGYLEDMGIKISLVSAGKYKVEGNPFEPLAEEGRAQMQREVDGYYDMFLESVAQQRGVSKATARDGFGQGRVLIAEEARAAGMVDGIATLQEVLSGIVKAKEPGTRGRQAKARLAFQNALRKDC